MRIALDAGHLPRKVNFHIGNIIQITVNPCLFRKVIKSVLFNFGRLLDRNPLVMFIFSKDKPLMLYISHVFQEVDGVCVFFFLFARAFLFYQFLRCPLFFVSGLLLRGGLRF